MDPSIVRLARSTAHLLPYVSREACFALKGGTALNMFVRDLPRLSVDIDLTYLPLEPRDASLRQISEALERIAATVKRAVPTLRVRTQMLGGPTRVSKVIAASPDGEIKIEPNEVLRGTVFPVQVRPMVPAARALFQMDLSMPVLSEADLYGGKFCAALDRQHPRDLFDVKLLLEHEGMTNEIRQAFVVYLASTDRPMHELLDPVRKDIRAVYASGFQGMTETVYSSEELAEAREQLIKTLHQEFTKDERSFLLSVKSGEPQWELMGLPGIEKLPGLQWKVQNVRRMTAQKRQDMLGKLKAVLN